MILPQNDCGFNPVSCYEYSYRLLPYFELSLAEVNKVDEDLEVSRDGRKQAGDWVQVGRGGGRLRGGGGGGKRSLRGERQRQSIKHQRLG